MRRSQLRRPKRASGKRSGSARLCNISALLEILFPPRFHPQLSEVLSPFSALSKTIPVDLRLTLSSPSPKEEMATAQHGCPNRPSGKVEETSAAIFHYNKSALPKLPKEAFPIGGTQYRAFATFLYHCFAWKLLSGLPRPHRVQRNRSERKGVPINYYGVAEITLLARSH